MTKPTPAKKTKTPPRNKSMSQKKTGRPTALAPDVQAKICAALSMGAYLEAAAAYAGIDRNTLARWLKWGEERGGIYAEFCSAVEEAKSKKVLRCLTAIHNAADINSMKFDWKAAAWVLERTEPENYGAKQKVEHDLGDKTRGDISTWIATVIHNNKQKDPATQPTPTKLPTR